MPSQETLILMCCNSMHFKYLSRTCFADPSNMTARHNSAKADCLECNQTRLKHSSYSALLCNVVATLHSKSFQWTSSQKLAPNSFSAPVIQKSNFHPDDCNMLMPTFSFLTLLQLFPPCFQSLCYFNWL